MKNVIYLIFALVEIVFAVLSVKNGGNTKEFMLYLIFANQMLILFNLSNINNNTPKPS